MLVTLAEILQRAADASLGRPDTLRHQFLHLQRVGLLGPAIAKAPRRGGEGLWHSAQGDLFLLHLRQLALGVRRATLANAVVGTWLLSWPGVDLPQTQRAMRFWAESVALPERTTSSVPGPSHTERAAGRRSLRRRGVMALVEQIAATDAGRPTRRRLRDALEDCLDQLPSPSQHSLDVLRAAIGVALRGDPGDARLTYERLVLRFGALAQLDLLTAERPDVTGVWHWLRSTVDVPSSLVPKFLNSACGTAAEGWGVAIRAQVMRPVAKDASRPPVLDMGGRETLWGRASRG